MADYDTIAAKYGGRDVEDLAAKYGGQDISEGGPSTPQPEDPRAAMLRAMSGPLGRMMEGADKFLEHAGYRVGGAVTDTLANAGTRNPLGGAVSPEVAAAAGSAANVAISEGIPAAIGGSAARTILSPAIRGISQGLMRYALKPSWREMMPGGTGRQAIQTMLNRRLEGNILPGENVSAGGVYNMEHHLNDIRDQIVDILRRPGSQERKLAEIRPLWESGKELYDAYRIAARRVSGSPLHSWSPYWWMHRPGMAAAYTVARSPMASSLAARGLNAGQNYVPFTAGALAHAAAGAPQGMAPYEETPYQTLEDRLP